MSRAGGPGLPAAATMVAPCGAADVAVVTKLLALVRLNGTPKGAGAAWRRIALGAN